ncbi:MAG: HAD-IIA family hydrolase [Dermatophilaceae bacterium]
MSPVTDPESDDIIDGYAGIVSDLDGVVYRGAEAVPRAVAALTKARARVGIVYATNNASRTVSAIAAQLAGVGLPVRAEDVVTSALAGAALLAEDLPAGSTVLAVGGEGVLEALRSSGFRPVRTAEPDVAAVLQGYGGNVTANDLGEASLAVAAGARWVATNTDRTLPIDRGIIPGNGTLVAAVATATGAEPTVVGKPFPPLYAQSARVLGTPLERTLAIGDRLETDIAGAQASGMDSVWVLTGVHGVRDLALGTATPTYAVLSLDELHHPYGPVQRREHKWCYEGVRVGRERDGLVVELDSASADSPEARRAVLRAGVAMVCDLRDLGLERGVLLSVATQLEAWAGRRASGTREQ